MKPEYTLRQGQYLAFIYYYTKLNRIPPAEVDFAKYFRASPPSVHYMLKRLAALGFISKEPGKPRSIQLLISKKDLPELE